MQENKVTISVKKSFSKEEAENILPLIIKITKDSSSKVNTLLNQLNSCPDQRKESIESLIDTEVKRWQSKLEKLGASPKGLWMADIDSGFGYYCWKFPEDSLKFHHSYHEGFSARVEIK